MARPKMAINELHYDGKGYVIEYKVVADELLDAISDKLDTCYPVRASTHRKKYAEAEDTQKLQGVAVWWSQLTDEWDEVQTINNLVYPIIQQHMPKAKFYASDIVTINGPSRWIGPHVDTPHRFTEYNDVAPDELLGIQVIIPLETLDETTGATGLIPFSHREDWDIQDCYDGVHDDMFKDEAVQHELPKGSVLFYNTRLMHSTMPLNLPKKRSILLLNYLRDDIIQSVTKIDNIWSSNGK